MCKRKSFIYNVGNVLSSCCYWKKSLGLEDKLYKGQPDISTGGLSAAWKSMYFPLDHLPKHQNYKHALKQRVSQQLLCSTRH